MSEMRSELRRNTQELYGHYCNCVRAKKKNPMPYWMFSNYYEKGFSVKEIAKF